MERISAILLAAGESTRMGFLKPLLDWHGVPLVGYQIRSLWDGGVSEIVVVVGHGHADVTPYVEAEGAKWVINPNYLDGKTTSIKVGLHAVSRHATGFLLLSVDQPRPPSVVKAVLDSHLERGAAVTSPRHKRRNGHPIVFSWLLRPELEAITEEKQGLREVFRAHRDDVNEAPVEDPIAVLDLNTPAEYEAARMKYDA